MDINTLHIVTPCLNAITTIDQTILSVISQAGKFKIRYHIQDGGSSDGTIERLEHWKKAITQNQLPLFCKGIHLTYDSAVDNGMYDAIIKAFNEMSIHRHAFMSWINSDDFYIQGAFAFIDDIVRNFPAKYVSWIGGNKLLFEETTPSITFENLMPTELIKEGLCDGLNWNHVQQEGVFFRKWLWQRVDAISEIREFKYAGDWNLWRLFAYHAKMTNTHLPLAAFRKHSKQLSQNFREAYNKELSSILSPKTRTESFKKIVESNLLRARVLKANLPESSFRLIERGANGLAHFHYHKLFNKYPPQALDKKKDIKETKIYVPSEDDCDNAKVGLTGFCSTTTPASKGEDQKTYSPTKNRLINPIDFPQLTFARRTHFKYFEHLDLKLYGRKVDLDKVHLKYYQDLLVFAFIQALVPKGSRILEIGGGNSRILTHFAGDYECWNIDKFEGLGNGPQSTTPVPYKLVLGYIGSFCKELPNDYFDFVFSISALEHTPKDQDDQFICILNDINRVLKFNKFSFHLFDVIFKKNSFWSNELAYFILRNQEVLTPFIQPEKIKFDKDLYVMSEFAYNNSWLAATKKSYEAHGRPSSLNILWKKK